MNRSIDNYSTKTWSLFWHADFFHNFSLDYLLYNIVKY